MNNPAPSRLLPESACDVKKRVILSMGGKGGVGKTSIMVGLAEWFAFNQIPVKLLDLDTENKARGSLTHFFDGRVPKVNIHSPAGLDAFIDGLADGAPVVLADMGAGSGQVTYEWFETMYPDIADAGEAGCYWSHTASAVAGSIRGRRPGIRRCRGKRKKCPGGLCHSRRNRQGYGKNPNEPETRRTDWKWSRDRTGCVPELDDSAEKRHAELPARPGTCISPGSEGDCEE